jgi:hypothetical protein
MKKILMVILFGMVAFFAQGSIAATLDLSAISSTNSNTLVVGADNAGSVSGVSFLNLGGFIDTWGITSTPSSAISAVTVENREENINITGVTLKDSLNAIVAFASESPTGTWNLFATLLAGANYIVEISGSALTTGQTYTLTVNAVPVPAAIWLFGSALMGLIGFSRRKSGSAVVAV